MVQYTDGIHGIGNAGEQVMNDVYMRSAVFQFLKPGPVTEYSSYVDIRRYIRLNKLNIKTGGVWSPKKILIYAIMLRRLFDTLPELFTRSLPIDQQIYICTCCWSSGQIFKDEYEQFRLFIEQYRGLCDPRSKIAFIKENWIRLCNLDEEDQVQTYGFRKEVLLKQFSNDDLLGSIVYDNGVKAIVVDYDMARKRDYILLSYSNGLNNNRYVSRNYILGKIEDFANLTGDE